MLAAVLIPLALSLPAVRVSPTKHAPSALPLVSVTRCPVLLSAEASLPVEEPLPHAKLLPIWLFIFVQSLGVGVNISTLPLHLLSLGASTVDAARVVSGFSGMQMVFAPLLVKLSDRFGRSPLLLLCMIGSVASNALTALSSSVRGVAMARLLAGAFAANLALAQAATTDLVTPEQATRALGLVSAAMTLGITLGPAFAAAATGAFAASGVPAALWARGVFAINAALGFAALSFGCATFSRWASPLPTKPQPAKAAPATTAGGKAVSVALEAPATPEAPSAGALAGQRVQLWLRGISFVVGWGITLSVSTYSIFAARRLGYGQREIGLLYSGAAAAALVTNVVALPRLVRRYGEACTCSLGLLLLGACPCRAHSVLALRVILPPFES